MPTIATLTLNPSLDKYSKAERIVAERKLRCTAPLYHPGGGGLNVARAVGELGGDVKAWWTCGGSAGAHIGKLLDEEGIAHQPIAIEAETRENLIMFEESCEQQYRFVMPGARLAKAELRSCLESLRAIDPPPSYLVLSGSLPPGDNEGFYAVITREMQDVCRLIVDTSGEALRRALEFPVYLIKPNLRELRQLAGCDVDSDAEICRAARSLIEDGRVQVVVVSLGAGGVRLATAGSYEHIAAPTVKIRSRVGAGDSTVAGIVHALSQGRSVEEAVHFGVAAGAAAVMTEGTELCKRGDVERLYQVMHGEEE